MEKQFVNYYEVLECNEKSDYDEIKSCFIKKIKANHPDKIDEECQERQAYAMLVIESWHILKNPDLKQEFDNLLEGMFVALFDKKRDEKW